MGGLDPRAVSGLAWPQCPGYVFVDSGNLTKTERPQSLDQVVAAQTLPQGGEIVVARIRNCLRRSKRRQVICVHARQREVQAVESSGTNCAGLLIDQSGAQRGQRGERFHRRTRHCCCGERRLRIHQRAYASALRVHDNDRAFVLAERGGRSFLQD